MHPECLFHVLACMFMYDVKLKSNSLREFMFSRLLKLNLCMFTVFKIKLEVAGTMMITHYLSSQDPTEKSYIYHSYVSASSSEDAVK